jgi:ferredoxin/flavodoxin---NADP+ reductase
VRNRLVHDDEGRLRAEPTDVEEVLETGLVFRAVGYTGVPLPGLPFDERGGVIPNVAGRVVDTPRTYVTGWIKRGPSGVIGTNKKCATDTVSTLLGDLAAGSLHADEPADPEIIYQELAARRRELVTYEAWERIDEAERVAGETLGRPRVKFTTFDELLRAAGTRSRA